MVPLRPSCCHAGFPKDTIVRCIFNTQLGTQFGGFPPQRCDIVPNDLSDWLSLGAAQPGSVYKQSCDRARGLDSNCTLSATSKELRLIYSQAIKENSAYPLLT